MKARTFVLNGLLLSLFSASALATNVIMETPFGDVEIELFDDEAPLTVANFLNYVNDGDYDDSIIHRSVRDFVIQGGGFNIVDDLVEFIPVDDEVPNEPGISNTRGTIAMAKRGDDPNSATSQWFINLSDNSENLDAQNEGFTVFGRVIGDGMEAVDAIAALRIWNLGSPFTSIPLIDYDGQSDVTLDNLVRLNVDVVSDFQINPGLNDAWFDPNTRGQGLFFTVFPDAGVFFLSWFTYDVERPTDDVAALLGEPGHRWLTAQGSFEGNRATLDVTLSSGGTFDSPDPVVLNEVGYGAIELTFADCDAVVLEYDLPAANLTGTLDLTRVVKDNVSLCEALQNE